MDSGSRNERVSLRCQASLPLANSSTLEGKALEDLAQNTHGSLAMSLTWHRPYPIPGVTGKVLALCQLQGEGNHVSQILP